MDNCVIYSIHELAMLYFLTDEKYIQTCIYLYLLHIIIDICFSVFFYLLQKYIFSNMYTIHLFSNAILLNLFHGLFITFIYYYLLFIYYQLQMSTSCEMSISCEMSAS